MHAARYLCTGLHKVRRRANEMDKDYATLRLGSEEAAARWLGISLAIYREWPLRLHRVMADRVYAAVLRRETAKAMGLTAKQFFADPRNEIFIESMIERIAIAAVVANLIEQAPPEYLRSSSERVGPTVVAPSRAGGGSSSKRRKRDSGKELAVEGLS
jgi:hypothetical protein